MKTGYISDDLMVIYHTPKRDDNKIEENFRKVWSSNNYIVFYCKKGKCEVQNGAIKSKVNDNQLIIIDAHNAFGYKFERKDDYECIYFQIDPSHFSNIKDDKNFLRAFEFIKPTDSVIDCNGENYVFKILFESLIECNVRKLGISHVLPRILSIISQLAIYYDKKFPNDIVTSDSVPTQIINFINRNYLSNITYDTITEKFFVSKPVINDILHKFTGLTLRQYVESLRLKDAKSLLSNKDAKKVANLCGYKTYSTFYRAYKRYYGTLPSEVSDNTKPRWPLSK